MAAQIQFHRRPGYWRRLIITFTPDRGSRHIDIQSIDAYWLAGSRSSAILNQSGVIYNLGGNATIDQTQRGFHLW